MTIMEIILLVIGLLAFVASFRIPAGKEELTEGQLALAEAEIKKMVQEKVEEATSQFSESMDETANYTVEKAERSLERLTNEKIMAVSEYADTVISDIHKNHEEVVFLYDMLNDKQTNLKNTVREVEQTAKSVTKQVEEVKAEIPKMEESKVNAANLAKQNDTAKKKDDFMPFIVPMIQVEEKPAVQTQAPPKKKAADTSKEEGQVADVAAVRIPNVPELLSNDISDEENAEHNSNEAILALHKAGKSNMAIARELGLGVGEVKLVIDLFKGM